MSLFVNYPIIISPPKCCFLESYIFEWVRGIDIGAINTYFPTDKKHPNYGRNLKKKWKEIPAELCEADLIPSNPILDLSDLGQLITKRNGLVHAKASRPFNSNVPQSEQPDPKRSELDEMNPGWAVEICVALVKQLHDGSSTPVPKYVGWSRSET